MQTLTLDEENYTVDDHKEKKEHQCFSENSQTHKFTAIGFVTRKLHVQQSLTRSIQEKVKQNMREVEGNHNCLCIYSFFVVLWFNTNKRALVLPFSISHFFELCLFLEQRYSSKAKILENVAKSTNVVSKSHTPRTQTQTQTRTLSSLIKQTLSKNTTKREQQQQQNSTSEKNLLNTST
jgi:hypothetical protein